MKKVILTLCLVLLAGALFAGVKGVVNFKPQFKFDNTPAADVETVGYYNNIGWKQAVGPQLDNWYMTKQDYWLEAFKQPSALDIGFTAQGDKFGLVFIMDVRQDTLAYFINGNKGNFSNIPFLKLMIELNFPRLGYIDYQSTDGNFYASLGRRQIKWGPATYDLAISDSQPFLDSAFITFDIPMNNGWKFWYSLTGIAYKYFLNYGKYIDKDYVDNYFGPSDDHKTWGPKTTFAHKFSMEKDNLRFTFAELNNVYGKDPSLLDFSPTVVWHDNYQDDFSNVMLSFTAEGKFGPVRAYANFTMDDYDLPHETPEPGTFSGKPPAIGFVAGIEINLFKGEEIKSSKFDYTDYVLREDTFKSLTGLNIGYELYYCSKFMYNRSSNVGKFTSPYQFISFAGSGYCFDENAFYLGFKYGPDSMLHRFYAEYTDNPLKAYFSAELLRRGSYTIDTEYSPSYSNAHLNTPYDLTAPVTTVLMLEAGCSYYLQEGFRLDASLGFTKDFTHDNQAFKASIGASIAVCDVDWANLF
ncbi:MAG: hypothetical protein J5775_02560 [Spirochaetales bacterium]|nr:hypothetical protein [Spirochaetales bacterium]